MLLTKRGVSIVSRLYFIHKDEDVIFSKQNAKDKLLVDRFVYRRYIKIILAKIEVAVAE